MHQSVLDAFPKRFTEPLEGRVASMYVDVKNLVTTAVGCLIDPVGMALTLPWTHEKTGQPATHTEVAAAWNTLKNHPGLMVKGSLVPLSKLHWKYAAQLNDLRLDDDAIDELVRKRMLANEVVMRKALHDWDNYPADAQLGCMSMAWAVGAGFTAKFGNFTHAANVRDWVAAKACCKIRTENNVGIIPRNSANELCFENAATVASRALDTTVLHWPNAAPRDGISGPPLAPVGITDEDRERNAGRLADLAREAVDQSRLDAMRELSELDTDPALSDLETADTDKPPPADAFDDDEPTTVRPLAKTLRPGDSGPEVFELQNLLNAAGAAPTLEHDGAFGPKTRSALVAFQSTHGLNQSGAVDSETWSELHRG